MQYAALSLAQACSYATKREKESQRERERELTERVGGLRALRAPLSAVALCLTVGGIRQIEILPAEEAEDT